jgi:hypothetical protein
METRKGNTLATLQYAFALTETCLGAFWIGCFCQIGTGPVVSAAGAEFLTVFRAFAVIIALGDAGTVFCGALAVQFTRVITAAVLIRANLACTGWLDRALTLALTFGDILARVFVVAGCCGPASQHCNAPTKQPRSTNLQHAKTS